MSARRPVIGLTMDGSNEHPVDYPLFDAHYTSPTVFIEAIRRAGGVPVLLPPGGEDSAAWLQIVDGVIFSGGADIGAAHYGGDPNHPALMRHAEERDKSELALIAALLNRPEVPTLFVCRGMQLLNVALGGTLHPHIPDVQTEDIHRSPEGGWTVQPVQVAPGSKLSAVMGTDYVETYSGHHQAVAKIGRGLTPVAHAPDGIVEALQLDAHRFGIAVQWHPEVTAATDESQQNLFNGLVRAAQASD